MLTTKIENFVLETGIMKKEFRVDVIQPFGALHNLGC